MKQTNSAYEKVLQNIKLAAQMPPEDAIPLLVKCAKQGFPLVASKAVQALVEQNHPSVVQTLIDLYTWAEEDPSTRDKACDIRIAIVEALGDNRSQYGVETLRKAIRTVHIARLGPGPEDVAIPLRAAAAIALAKADSNALYELSLLLFDMQPHPKAPTAPVNVPFVKAPTRKAAAMGIGILGDLGGLPLLAVKLKHTEGEVPDVLAECLESLIAMQPEYVMEVTLPYLRGTDEYLSAITALALAENYGIKVMSLLLETLEQVQGEAKEAIVTAISIIRSSETREVLQGLSDDPSPYVRKAAKQGLENFGGNLDEKN